MTRILLYILIAIASWFPAIATAQMTVPAIRTASGFNHWRTEFRFQALAAGISGRTFDAAFRKVDYDPSAEAVDANQAEFVRPIWEYLDDAVSANRISTGKSKARSMQGFLRTLEHKYRVDSQILLAIWGMETNFGSFRGDTYTIEALANAAYDGRRRTFAETELIAALKILDRGDVTPSRMLGSGSGAMGHTQFMPSTYLRYAVDQTRTGRANIWSDNPNDALASTANYLHQLGWKNDQPWGVEVTLPSGFDYARIGERDTHSADFWNARGVRTTGGHRVPNHGETALLAPAGANGPIFAIFPNFQIIRQYNMSVSYSLAVGHLSDRIIGGGSLKASWPRADTPMTRVNQQEIQELLQKRGFDVGPIDGMIGPKTIEAIQAFQVSEGLLADGYATPNLLIQLRP
jgi:lytic murein transglycosylase